MAFDKTPGQILTGARILGTGTGSVLDTAHVQIVIASRDACLDPPLEGVRASFGSDG